MFIKSLETSIRKKFSLCTIILLFICKILSYRSSDISDEVEDFSENNSMLPFSHDIDFVRTMPSLLSNEYQSQLPFPHIHIHDFFDERLISKAANEFPNFTNSTFDVSLQKKYYCVRIT